MPKHSLAKKPTTFGHRAVLFVTLSGSPLIMPLQTLFLNAY
jgi:hypothetical protein